MALTPRSLVGAHRSATPTTTPGYTWERFSDGVDGLGHIYGTDSEGNELRSIAGWVFAVAVKDL